MRSFGFGGVAACWLLACGGNVALGGPGDGGTGDATSSSSSSGAGSSSGSGSGSSSGTSGTDAAANPLSGTYTGYIESYQFPDGSDVVTMNLVFATDGTITGTVYFGSGPPLPQATNPDVGYPPGYTGGQVLEGFDFTVLGGTYAAPPRVQLSVSQAEVWKHWCEIQTTIYPRYNGQSDGGCGGFLDYGCLPNVAGGGTGGADGGCEWTSCEQPSAMLIDCGKFYLCSMGMACQCTATACTVPIGSQGGVAFDMQLANGAMDGSVTIGGQVYNVHLKHGP